MKVVLLPLALSACTTESGPQTLEFAGKSYAVLQGRELEMALMGHELHYETQDGLGHARLPFHGPENFGARGDFSFRAHRGWIERGKFWVAKDKYCVKTPTYGQECQQLFRSSGGELLAVGAGNPWPVKLLPTIKPQ